MSKLVSRRIKVEEAGNAQALIFEADNGWRIEYYDPRGTTCIKLSATPIRLKPT